MAINNFTRARMVGDQLEIQGTTTKPGTFGKPGDKVTLEPGSTINVAVIAVGDPFKRCEAHVANPAGNSWTAESVGTNPFVNHDHVHAVGVQRDADDAIVRLWADTLCIGAPDLTL